MNDLQATGFLNNMPAFDRHLERALENLSASVYCKDKKGKYLEVNKVFLETAAINETDILGKTDKQLIWSDRASALMKNDQKVICNALPHTAIETVMSVGKDSSLFLSHKTPLYGRGKKIIGVFCLSFLLDGENTILTSLNESGLFTPSLLCSNQENNLTKRQADCLYFLVKGATYKEISRVLNISIRTVEHHLDAVKEKLKCHTRSQLINKGLQLDFIRKRL